MTARQTAMQADLGSTDQALARVGSAARRTTLRPAPALAAPAAFRRGWKPSRGVLRVAVKQAQGAAPPAKAPPPPPPVAEAAVVTSAWPCKGGSLVRVLQQGPGGGDQHTIRIVLEGKGIAEGSTVELHWGVYRSALHLWQHPADVVPPGSRKDERSGAMCSAMQAGGNGTYSLTLRVPATLAPLTLAFVAQVTPPPGTTAPRGRPVRPAFVTPLRGRHFSALVGCSSGSSAAQGVTLLAATEAQAAAAVANPAAGAKQKGKAGKQAVLQFGAGTAQRRAVNFAVRCRGADRVCLVLLRPHAAGSAPPQQQQGQQQGQPQEWGMLELVLDPVLNRTGELWHIAVDGLADLEDLCYGWRLEGDVSWESGCRVQPDLLLVDPCCPALRYFPAEEAAVGAPLPLPTLTLSDGTAVAVASSLAGLAEEQARAHELAAMGPLAAAEAAAEAYVPPPDHALEELRLFDIDVRTFAQGKGVQHPGSFLGVAERVGHIKAMGANAVVLTPSYATAKGIGLLSRAAVHHLAADPQLSASDRASNLAAAADFRAMVRALHAAGVEVLVQFDLTFTAEGTDATPSTLSLRGLDYAAYYRRNGVLNCGHPAARAYVLRALHHWAREGADGFVFINAENMAQDREGLVLDAPPLAEAICHDPVLKRLKLIALPSDDALLPRQGVRGFPHWGLWQQRNLGFGRDMLAYMAEDTPGLLTAVAGRLTGSAAIFDADWGAGLPGNLAIGRRPAFGVNSVTVLGRQSLAELAAEAAELAAAAAGYAGSYNSAAPSAATIAKSLLVLAVLSSGVPTIPQDAVVDLPSAHFVGVLMRLRRRLAPLLLPPLFDSPRDIRWHSAADPAAEPAWDPEMAGGARDANYLGFSVRILGGQAVYVGINPCPYPINVVLPPPPPARTWERIVDTSLPAPDDALLEGGAPVRARSIPVAAKAVVVLEADVLETVALPPQ